MANVIEIVIRAKDQATAQLKAAEAQSASLATRLAALTVAAGVATAAAAVLGRTVYGLAKSFADEVEQLSNVAKTSGATVQQVQTLNKVLEESGLGANSGAQAMMFLSKAIARNDELLAKLGITSRNPYQAMLQLSDAFARSNDQATKNGVSFRLLGRGGAEMAVVMDTLRDSAGKMNAELARTGGLITDADAAIGSAADAIIDMATRRVDALSKRLKVAASMMVLYLASVTPLGRALLGSGPSNPGGAGNRPPVGRTWGEDSLSGARDLLAGGGAGRGAIDLSGAFGGAPGTRSGAGSATPFESMVKTLQMVEVPALKFTETGERMAKALDGLARISSAFTNELTGNWSRTLANVTQITTQTNNVVFQLLIDLGNAIIGTITDAIARAAGSAVGNFILSAVSFGVTATTGVPLPLPSGGSGAGIGPRGGSTGFSSGNTFVIQSFNARSTLQELVSPSGSFRRAGDRMGELARA